MYTLIQHLPVRVLARVQAPSLLLSLVVAELFYKFGSFTLECVAFLATWGLLDLAISSAWRLAGADGARGHDA